MSAAETAAELDRFGCAYAGTICSRVQAAELRAAILPVFDVLGRPFLHADAFLQQPEFAATWPMVVQLLAQSRAMAAVHQALGPDVCILSALSLFRQVVGATSSVPFHQDVNFTGAPYRIINCWVTLDDCGTTAPGLEVLRRRFGHNLHGGRRRPAAPQSFYAEHYLGETLDDILGADQAAAAELLGPRLEAGTGILFDQFCLHRTQPMTGAFRRVALELRVASLPAVLQGAIGHLSAGPLFIVSRAGDSIRLTLARSMIEIALG